MGTDHVESRCGKPFRISEVSLSEYARWESRYAAPGYAFGKEPNYFAGPYCHRLGGCLRLRTAKGGMESGWPNKDWMYFQSTSPPNSALGPTEIGLWMRVLDGSAGSWVQADRGARP